MSKKISMIAIAIIAVIAGVAGISAFEAHIINVTAHIENALAVTPEKIEFGTVFPQEFFTKDFKIQLSSSFAEASRVDDVDYVIHQKLKPCPLATDERGVELVPPQPVDPTCVADTPTDTPHNPTGFHYLNLCPFLSKVNTESDGSVDQNDTSHPSYFVPASATAPAHCEQPASDAAGHLTKQGKDTVDDWILDLKVPPISGTVGQDWPQGCPVVESNDITYGCDLWIEVTGISEQGICADQADVMLVLDRSDSIDAAELVTMKTAAHAFVNAMNPDGGVHMGQTSFSTNGTLDTHLTGNKATIDANIDALATSGFTNLFEGIQLAKNELDDTHVDERPSVKDFMVIITDGSPNRPVPPPTAPGVAATEADAARAAGIEIFAVGIGVTPATETYLQNDIADDAAHYFSAANFNDLENILKNIAACQNQ